MELDFFWFMMGLATWWALLFLRAWWDRRR